MEAFVLVVVALVIGGAGVAVGILVSPRITRLTEPDDDDQHDAEPGDEPPDEGGMEDDRPRDDGS